MVKRILDFLGESVDCVLDGGLGAIGFTVALQILIPGEAAGSLLETTPALVCVLVTHHGSRRSSSVLKQVLLPATRLYPLSLTAKPSARAMSPSRRQRRRSSRSRRPRWRCLNYVLSRYG